LILTSISFFNNHWFFLRYIHRRLRRRRIRDRRLRRSCSRSGGILCGGMWILRCSFFTCISFVVLYRWVSCRTRIFLLRRITCIFLLTLWSCLRYTTFRARWFSAPSKLFLGQLRKWFRFLILVKARKWCEVGCTRCIKLLKYWGCEWLTLWYRKRFLIPICARIVEFVLQIPLLLFLSIHINS